MIVDDKISDEISDDDILVPNFNVLRNFGGKTGTAQLISECIKIN